MFERGDRAVPGERAGVTARQLAGFQRDGEDLTLAHTQLNAAADQPRVQRVVAGIETQVRVRRHPRHPPAIGVRRRGRQWRHHGVFLDEPVDRTAAQRLCTRGLGRVSNHASSRSWRSSSLAKRRPGSKLFSMTSCRRSTTRLASGSRGSQKCQPTRSQDHTRAIASFTLWDKYAVGTATLSPIVYYWGTNLANAALLTPVARRDREELRQAWTVSRARAVGVGLLSPLAYVLIRYALARAPVSYVAPAREGSIVVGSLLCGVPAALTVLPTEAPLSTA